MIKGYNLLKRGWIVTIILPVGCRITSYCTYTRGSAKRSNHNCQNSDSFVISVPQSLSYTHIQLTLTQLLSVILLLLCFVHNCLIFYLFIFGKYDVSLVLNVNREQRYNCYVSLVLHAWALLSFLPISSFNKTINGSHPSLLLPF